MVPRIKCGFTSCTDVTIMRPIVGILMAAAAVTAGSASQRIRFGPGVCGPIDPIYIKGATETGGQPYPMSTAEVGKSSHIWRRLFCRR
jgi:hypothetical protein